MYRLYWSPGGANMAPHAALEEIGAAYELVGLDFDRNQHKGAEYLRLNPNGRVPTLIHDGKAMYESAAILLYLCERHPDAKLMPLPGSPERGLFLQWLVFCTNTVQEEMMHWWHADYYMDSEAGRAELKRIAERRLAGMWTQICKNSGRSRALPAGPDFQRRRYLPGHALPLDPQDGEAGHRLAGTEAAG